MLVFDTSAFINGRNDHYPAETFPSVWPLVEQALADGRIFLARQVWIELCAKDDEIKSWIKGYRPIDPVQTVQESVGEIYLQFTGGNPPARRRRPARDRGSEASWVHGGDLRGPLLQRRSDRQVGADDAGYLPAIRCAMPDAARGAGNARRSLLREQLSRGYFSTGRTGLGSGRR